jgi:hypothetical protein
MTVAALLVFGSLLAAWLGVPAERRRRAPLASPTPQAAPEVTAEAA